MRKKRIKNPNYHGEIPKATFEAVVRKSKAGIEYTKYVQVLPPNPKGANHLARRRMKGIAKRKEREAKQ